MSKTKDLEVKERLKIQDRALVYLQGENWMYDERLSVFCYDTPGLNLNKNPWIDQWNVENAKSLYQPFPWHCDYPKPLLPPARLPRGVLGQGDPGLDLLWKKTYIAEDVEIMSRYFKRELKDLDLGVKDIEFKPEGKVSTTSLPRFVADLSELMEMDPDPEFKGKYNYYFNGGSLANIRTNDENILLFPYMGELIAAPLMHREISMWKPNLKRAAKCELEGQLFELKQIVSDCGYQVMARLKHVCEFFAVSQKGDKLRLMSKCKYESSVPLISADANGFNPNEFCAVDIKGVITLRDMETRKKKLKGQLIQVSTEDTWRSVKFHKWKPHLITLADRSCIHYLDLRQSINNPVVTMRPKPYLNEHEWISLEIPSNNEACHYVGTYHSLLMLDSRHPEEPTRQKWTHQLQSAPITADLISHSGKEVVTLATQLPGDVKIILNTWEDCDEPHSFHMPYAPSSMLDTLRECHLLGKCLDPLMRTRLKLSTAGSRLIQDGSQNIYFFTQNSIGDIFYQGLNYEEVLDKNSYVNTSAYYALEVWEKRMLEQNFVAPLVLSDQANMGIVVEAFTNKDLKYQEPARKILKDREKSPRGKRRKEAQKRRKKNKGEEEESPPSWKHSITRLSRYTDRLAPALLEIWEVTGLKDRGPQAGPNEKVLSWLQYSEEGTQEPPLSQGTLREEEEDDCVLTPVFSQELISVSQQQESRNDFGNPDVRIEHPGFVEDAVMNEDYDPFDEPTRKENVNKRKEAKRKTNFTAGF